MRGSIALVMALCAAPASAQSLEIVPEPPEADREAEPTETELIRWASDEVRRHEGRPAPAPRPPLPPDAYLATGTGAEDALPHRIEEDLVRVFAELGGGVLGFAIGAGLGTLVVWGALEANASPDAMIFALGGGALLGAFGVTGGVVLAGDLTGGRGNFGYAFLGQTIGSFAALPIVVLALAEGAPELALVAAGLLPLAGAVLAYEIAHADGTSQVAFVSPTSGGAIGGVAGTIP